MKRFAWFLLFMSSTGFAVENQNQKDITKSSDKISYSLGYDLGIKVIRELANINFDLFEKGLEDAYFSNEPLVDKEEMEFLIADYRREIKRQVTGRTEQGERNQKAGQRFLDENRLKEGVVTLASGLQYEILKNGKGKKPNFGDRVEVHHKGMFIDGRVFTDTVKAGESVRFLLTKEIIPGWSEALQLMPSGSRWRLFIPSDLAYGVEGQQRAGIGPNKVLIFEVELLKILDAEEKKGK